MVIDDLRKRKILVITASIGVLIITGIILAALLTPRTTPTVDTSSQEERFVQVDAGITDLVAQGVSNAQVNAIKIALLNFAKKSNLPIDSFRIDRTSIKTEASAEGNGDYFALFTMKDTSGSFYKIRTSYFAINSIQMTISSETGVSLFDSGVITSN